MPLSKKRMRERKRADRAESRFDRFHLLRWRMLLVQPNPYNKVDKPELDADGNIIPGYD